MEIKSVCVAGAGLMGRQIALASAIAGYSVKLYDVSSDACAAAQKWSDDYLEGRIKKGRMSEETVADIKGRFGISNDLSEAASGTDMLIEAIVEREDVKREFFRGIDEIVREDTIVATNSSFMVSSKFADCIKNPSRLGNMHFYNPALVMEFVEVVQGPHTSSETAETMVWFCRSLGKCPIRQLKEIEGFAGNYLIEGLRERARYLVENGYCTFQEVDIALEKGFNHKMGVFRMDDFTGIDLALDVMESEYERTGVKPCMYDTYKQMVKENKTGVKSGHGFYDY